MSEDFNQKYDQLSKKHKSSKIQIEKLHQTHTIIDEVRESKLADSISKIFSVGGGKEALVLLAEKEKKIICVKYFYTNSASNIKRTKQQHHVETYEMSSIMAKTEFQNLRILDYYGVNIPKPLEFNNGLAFSMKMIPNYQNSKLPAPVLKTVNLRESMDPGYFLDELLDQIEIMFKKANMVHGDLSEFNILVSDEKPFIIDVSQSRLINVKTFTQTPIRIRIDDALNIFVRDLETILNHFEKKYKIFNDKNQIFEKMFNSLPDFVKKKDILNTYASLNTKNSRVMFMKDREINNFTSMTLRKRDKKMLNLIRSLTSQ